MTRYSDGITHAPQFENEYDQVKWCLLNLGNTIVVKKPNKMVKKLESEGIHVKVKHYTKKQNKYIFSIMENRVESKFDDAYREDWVLERVENERRCRSIQK